VLSACSQQRVPQQQLDRVIDQRRGDGAVIADVGVGVQQLARDALGRQVRADAREICRDGLLGELAEREIPDRRDRWR
jgi:hypothetical protein